VTARAMWKAVLRFDEVRVPVKLYSAVQDRSVHFRLLHEPDRVPLRQRMINPRTGNAVEHREARRGLEVEPGVFVMFREEELEGIEPKASRDIRISRFVPSGSIPHARYERPYYLGPDGDPASYFALARALARREREGLGRWVMRRKAYLGALRAYGDHLLLISLRHADAVITATELDAPSGRPLEERERAMAEQFVAALEERFDPSLYWSGYRDRVMQLIERKRSGETIEIPEYEEKRAPDELAELLEASLARIG
jgi:DNA end-binding protein Ku